MTKRIFEETESDFNPTLKPKQEFSAEAFEVFEDTETEEVEEADLSFEEVVRPNRLDSCAIKCVGAFLCCCDCTKCAVALG